MTDLVGHFIIFGVVAVVLLAVPLIIGWFVRPNLPTPEKVAVYECGEPTIGSSYIQFDLRFYVVALLFIIFDVEVAFFFPWALIYGGHAVGRPANQSGSPGGDFGEAAQRSPVAGCAADRVRHRLSPGRFEFLRHPGLLRGAAGWLRLCVEAGRPQLGPRGNSAGNLPCRIGDASSSGPGTVAGPSDRQLSGNDFASRNSTPTTHQRTHAQKTLLL
jgi:NADH:ubiquinone oxidoreductase subunit 3 (subunit A)